MYVRRCALNGVRCPLSINQLSSVLEVTFCNTQYSTDMEAVWENLWSYSGYASVVLVTAVIGFIPWIATWLDGKLEKLALREVLAELKSKVCAF